VDSGGFSGPRYKGGRRGALPPYGLQALKNRGAQAELGRKKSVPKQELGNEKRKAGWWCVERTLGNEKRVVVPRTHPTTAGYKLSGGA
jgi:hypothetical protein